MVQHVNVHTHQQEDRYPVPGPPKLGISITKQKKEEMGLFGNGREPPWISAGLDYLHDAGCRNTARPALGSQISPLFLEMSC